ncbi:MAG: alpha/beta hydrolase [Candidatus Nanopelagicales bacterium]|jgi:pimeloyl-ACP methyl ester carboxylesterase|nr:alpha/beta hydrolase [Candidatus Nanopelagicales bacterium]
MGQVPALSRILELPGLHMRVVEAGAGEPVLLLHGFPQDSREYARVMELLADGARVIAPDLRGAGGTDAPAGRYDLATMQGDLLALLDALGLDRVALVAHDWSAMVGFLFCLDHPDRVSRYVALAVPPPYVRPHPAMVRSMRYLWFQYGLATPVLGPRLLAGGSQRLPRWLFRTFTARPDSISAEDAAAYLGALRAPARARAGSALYRQLIVPGFVQIMMGRYRDRVLEVPALVLFGEQDDVIPTVMLQGFDQHARDLTIDFVPGAAHYIVDDEPGEVARRIARFLALPVGS